MSDQPSFRVYNPTDYSPPQAMFFGALGEPAIAVTARTPLPVTSWGAPGSLSLIERLNREGDPAAGAGDMTFTTFSSNATSVTAIGSPAPGRATYVQSVSFWSTTPIAGRVQFANAISSWPGTGTAPLLDIGYACSPTLACPIIPVNLFVRSSDRFGIAGTVRRWLDPAVTGTHYVGYTVSGFTLADSINFDARKVILCIGNSTWSGTGPSTVDTFIPALINRFYRDAGVDTRYILKAYSGSTTTGHEAYRRTGKYDFGQVDAIFYNVGINDAVQAVPTATSLANLQSLVAWKQARYPEATLVLVGPTPLQNATAEAALAALRTAEETYVAGLGDPRVLFCDLGASFDRAMGANYTASDGADGTRIHPADVGLTQVWSGGYNGASGLRAWLAAHLPAM